jgi:ABC-type Fe3+-hydroxamate transport system substrate-binding protein
MPVYTDQLGNTVELSSSPRRIVSLVPSQTELLFHLGLDERVAGITKFCVHPESWFRTKTRVGGTKTVKTAIVDQIQPDLVLANKEENDKEQVEALRKRYPVWTSDVHNLDSALDMIGQVGAITGTSEKAASLVSRIQSAFSRLRTRKSRLRTCYLIWRDPYMTVGGDTFIHDMLGRCGLDNIFGHLERYPVVDMETLRKKKLRAGAAAIRALPFQTKACGRIAGTITGRQDTAGRW